MSSRLCKLLLSYFGNIMMIALLIAFVGAFFLFVSLLFGGLAVLSSSPSAAALLANIFADPFWGKLAAIGLVLFVGGLLLLFVLIVLYVLLTVLCCSLASDLTYASSYNNAGRLRACDCGALCLLGPLFPALAFLILVLVVALILFLGTANNGAPGVSPDVLAGAARWTLALFGLLLALAPFIWCCCKACQCKDAHTVGAAPSYVAAPRPVDPSEGPQ
jgi:hypothetical protein